jgi:hypothetical protein
MRIRRVGDKSFRFEFVGHALNGLARKPHYSGKIGYWLWFACHADRAEHLPPCAREVQVGDELVTGTQQAAVEPEHR